MVKRVILTGVLVLTMLAVPFQEILPRVMAAGGQADVTVDEAYDMLQSGKYLFLDVRSPEEYRLAHIEGAINMPVDKIEDQVHKLDKSKPILVYCKTGITAAFAADILAGYGFEVHNILGAIFEWGQKYKTTPHQYGGEARTVTMTWLKDQVYPLKMSFYSHETGAEGVIDMPYLGGEQPSYCPGDAMVMGFAPFVALKVQEIAEDLGIELGNVVIEATEGLKFRDGRPGLPMYVTYEIETESEGSADLIIEELRERIDFEKTFIAPPVWRSEKLGGILGVRAVLTGDNRATTIAGGGAVEHYAFDTPGIIDPRDAILAAGMACFSMMNVMLGPLFGVSVSDYKVDYTAYWETLDGVTWWNSIASKVYSTVGEGQTEMYNVVMHFNSLACPVGSSMGFPYNPASGGCGTGANEITEVANPVVPGLTDVGCMDATSSMVTGLCNSLPSLLVMFSEIPSSIPNLFGDLAWADITELCGAVCPVIMEPAGPACIMGCIGNLPAVLMILGGNK